MALQRGFFAGKVNKIFVHHLVFKSGLYVGATNHQLQSYQLSAIADSYVDTVKKNKNKYSSQTETDNAFNQQLQKTLVVFNRRESSNRHVKLTCSNLESGRFVLTFQDKESPQNQHKIHFVVQEEMGHVLLRNIQDRDRFILFCKQYWDEVKKLGFLKVDMPTEGLGNHEAQLAEARILNKVQPKALTEKQKQDKFDAEMKEAKAYDAHLVTKMAEAKAIAESPSASQAQSASPTSSISSIGSSVSNSPVQSPAGRATVVIEAFSPRENAAIAALPLIRVKS